MAIFGRDSTAGSSVSSRRSSDLSHSSAGSKKFGSLSSHTSVSSRSGSSSAGSQRRSFLHRTPEDPSIQSAREQVVRAETAEHEADRALIASRKAVKEAREHVKHLEREAAEEARLARIKQDQAKSISKRAKPLGREYT
ncbi:hypothetical protein N7478_012787 [Penicillium angulare]|uniref:uncharacterized protein n=1 Tax=Penicillium angulare TaxID=116970 RepID=UPI00254034BF|nr:uncharacterized protein N7478_012787 [Penicillium angulare]KAJ5256683.1 hypothetical protein N7478_012787 [Penicillium angulare]